MKKFLLLFHLAVIFCSFNASSQILAPTPTTVDNNGIVTLTGENETLYRNFVGDISFSDLGLVTTPSGYRIYLEIKELKRTQVYDNSWSKPSKFSFKITNSTNENVTVTIPFKCTLQNSHPDDAGIINSNYIVQVTVTVKPTAPTVFYNDAKSQAFSKNDCGAGFESDPIVYSVPANKYSSTISKADANAKAQTEITANGQNKANTEGVCKQVYYNTEISASFTRNNCDNNSTPGPAINYIVPANKHKSLLSQADADAKAQTDINTNGQNYANTNGICIETRRRYRVWQRPNGECSPNGEISMFVWINSAIDFSNFRGTWGAKVYTTENGSDQVEAGNYRFFIPLNSSQIGYPVFKINYGQILSHTICGDDNYIHTN